jgi:hypothetical protein
VENQRKLISFNQTRFFKVLYLNNLKQMQIILSNGFTEKELSLYKNNVYRNILTMFILLISAAQNFGYTIDVSQKEIVLYLLKADSKINSEEFVPNEEIEKKLVSLWGDKAIQQSLEHKMEIGLEDSAE